MNFDFDLLDPTKIIPEELVPVTPIGRFVLNRNVDNFFAETEQVAFCPGHIVPGIDLQMTRFYKHVYFHTPIHS